MAKFLNTSQTSKWINELITKAKKEVVLIVPYIKTSENIFKSLKKADDKGIDITLIYRENKLSNLEKGKLSTLNNINLLHHPNIHAKCYFNGEFLLVGSMNLYEYSEKNNREMSILFECDYYDDSLKKFISYNDEEVFEDAKKEINEIITSSKIEYLNPERNNNVFEINILRSYEDIEQIRCNHLNKVFQNKRFKPFKYEKNIWYSICPNYFDKIDVVFEHNRIAVIPKFEKSDLKAIYENWKKHDKTYEFVDFKYYWNNANKPILIYREGNIWDEINSNKKKKYLKTKEGINSIIDKFRQVSGK